MINISDEFVPVGVKQLADGFPDNILHPPSASSRLHRPVRFTADYSTVRSQFAPSLLHCPVPVRSQSADGKVNEIDPCCEVKQDQHVRAAINRFFGLIAFLVFEDLILGESGFCPAMSFVKLPKANHV